jgi:hypothetical protein
VEANSSDDAALLLAACEHARQLTVALAADQHDLAQPQPSISSAELIEGREALAGLLGSLSHLTDSLHDTTQQS